MNEHLRRVTDEAEIQRRNEAEAHEAMSQAHWKWVAAQERKIFHANLVASIALILIVGAAIWMVAQ